MIQSFLKFFLYTFSMAFLASGCFAQSVTRDFYEIKIYHLQDGDQEKQVDEFLEQAYLPALDRAGINTTGVFKPVGQDTATTKKIFVLIPYTSAEEFMKTAEELEKDENYNENGRGYLQAPYDNPPYERIETILLQAFEGMAEFKAPKLTTPASERIYELRSYESATEELFKNKVRMFNEGEIAIFDRLNFNPVFFGEVVAGSRMPNLMYMTSFENMAVRNDRWKAFGEDPAWGEMSGMEEFRDNVSHIDVIFLRPASYSRL